MQTQQTQVSIPEPNEVNGYNLIKRDGQPVTFQHKKYPFNTKMSLN